MFEPADDVGSLFGNEPDEKRKEGVVSCNRYVLIVFNIIFFVIGVFLFTLSLWIRFVPSSVILLAVGTSTRTREYVMFLTVLNSMVGSFIMFLAFIGCCGSFSKSKYILGTFFMFMIALFFILFANIGLTIWLQTKINFDVRLQLTETFINNYFGENATNIESIAWERIQTDLSCCGVSTKEGYRDYNDLVGESTVKGETMRGAAMWRNSNRSDPIWPMSCCVRHNNTGRYVDLIACQTNLSAVPHARFSQGCQEEVKHLLKLNIYMEMGLLIALVVIQLLTFYTLRHLEAAMLGLDTDSVITEVSLEMSDGLE